MKPLMQFAQGDLLFTRVASVPKTAARTPPQQGRHVLALGETTGHMHSITADGVIRHDEGNLTYLTIEEVTAPAEHQEHGAHLLDPGVWLVERQRELSVVDLMPRQVND